MPVITNPEITKKTSTPTKPPREGEPGVEGDDERDGQGTQALDVAPMTGRGRAIGSDGSGRVASPIRSVVSLMAPIMMVCIRA